MWVCMYVFIYVMLCMYVCNVWYCMVWYGMVLYCMYESMYVCMYVCMYVMHVCNACM